jgi:hypothetical protein
MRQRLAEAGQRSGRPAYRVLSLTRREQNLAALVTLQRLIERALEIFRRVLVCTVGRRRARGLAKRRRRSFERTCGSEQQLSRDRLRRRATGRQRGGGSGVCPRPLMRGSALVDRAAEEWMGEPQRQIGAQKLDAGQRRHCLGQRLPLYARELDHQFRVGAVPKNSERPC